MTSASHLTHEETTVIPPSNLEGKPVSQISKGNWFSDSFKDDSIKMADLRNVHRSLERRM